MRHRRGNKCESPIEWRLYGAMIDLGLLPTPQYPILQYFVDFAFPEHRLVVECDGKRWHSTPLRRWRDLIRERRIRRQGWRVIRFTGKEIWHDPYKCAKTIRRALR